MIVPITSDLGGYVTFWGAAVILLASLFVCASAAIAWLLFSMLRELRAIHQQIMELFRGDDNAPA